jgi:hypothetical protein
MLKPGTMIGGCRIVSRLGQGGMGTVYRAEQISLGRPVALKVMAPALQYDVESGERFLREARTAAAVCHANVVSIIDVGRDQDRLYLVQELVTGGSAREMMDASGGILGEQRALHLMADCTAGLQAIHQARLVHRDIKPENILLTGDGSAKLADFGLARPVGASGGMDMTGSTMGTPAYMSPEQAQGIGTLDIRSDIFSLGATLYSLVTGKAPYKGDTVWAVVANMLTGPTPDPRQDHPGLSDALVAVITRAMAKNPAERYATPQEMRQDLDHLLRQRSGEDDRTRSRPTTATHGTTRKTLYAPAGTAPGVAFLPLRERTPTGTRSVGRIARGRTGSGAASRPLLAISVGGAAVMGAALVLVLLQPVGMGLAAPAVMTPTAGVLPPVTTPSSEPQLAAAVGGPYPFIARQSIWRFHDGGVDLGKAWRAPAFDDATWKSGAGPFGYGDPWIRTTVDHGPDSRERHHTTYYRRTFTVPAGARFTGLDLALMCDDGGVIHLNGREVARHNMPDGVITAATGALAAVGDADEERYWPIALDPQDLRPGINVIAVEIHQWDIRPTDQSFDLGLAAR